MVGDLSLRFQTCIRHTNIWNLSKKLWKTENLVAMGLQLNVDKIKKNYITNTATQWLGWQLVTTLEKSTTCDVDHCLQRTNILNANKRILCDAWVATSTEFVISRFRALGLLPKFHLRFVQLFGAYGSLILDNFASCCGGHGRKMNQMNMTDR